MSGYHKRDWETFPMHKIRRVDRPTILIKDDEVQRCESERQVSARLLQGTMALCLRKSSGVLYQNIHSRVRSHG